MSTLLPAPSAKPLRSVPLLVNGDRMKQPEFHRRYQSYPDGKQFELVGGIVYVASPLRRPHATYHSDLNLVLGLYAAGTPGVEAGDNSTMILGEESEPQPDLDMRILREHGGQSYVNDEAYLVGAPELVVEVAYSSRSLDMNQKRDDYRLAGVREYLVYCIEEEELHWFQFPAEEELKFSRDGICRSVFFPGLWIDRQALIDHNGSRLIEVVQQGLASRPHAAFVKRLAAARRKQS